MNISDLKEKGIPVVMKDGRIVVYCDSITEATSLILDLDDFPELKERSRNHV